jgi:hypothetical protein
LGGDEHTLGEKGMQVSTDMIKKYMFAARLNWSISDFGTQLTTVYL